MNTKNKHIMSNETRKTTTKVKPANATIDENAIKKNGKPLLEELIPNIPAILEEADKFDIDGLRRFLSTTPEKPLIVLGNGSTTAHKYSDLLYSSFNAIGTAMTPYMANSLSDTTIKNSKFLMISDSGNDIDVRYIADRILKLNPSGFALITSSIERKNRFNKIRRNYVLDMAKEKVPENCFTHHVEFGDGFIAVNSTIHNLAIIERAFCNNRIASKLNIPEQAFTYPLNDPSIEGFKLPELENN